MTIRNLILILCAGIFSGTILILAAYSLPTERIYYHMQKSADTYKIERDAPRWGGTVHTRLDNFTTSIMIMKAAYPVEGKILNSALLNPSWKLRNNAPTNTLIEVSENNLQAENDAWNYSRYWHGYLIFLKPLMLVSNLSHLRELNFFLQFLLTLTALFLLYKKLGIYHAYIFALILAIINPITAALDFQISSVYYVTIISVIFILLKNEFLQRGANILYFFAVVGIVTVYLDFLTYPFVTFGVPLCVYIFLNSEKIFSTMPLKFLCKNLFAWSFGYFGMWAGKWIIATLLTDSNVIQDALGAANYRSSFNLVAGEGGHAFTTAEMLIKVLGTFFRGSAGIFAAIVILYILYSLIKNRKKIIVNKNKAATLAFIIFLPLLWYVVFSNHSYVHNFLSYREFTIAVYGIAGFFIESKIFSPIKYN